MFTGIVTAQGRIVRRAERDQLVEFAVAAPFSASDVVLGASICHAGVCLTVTAIEPQQAGCVYTVEVAAESLAVTTLGSLQPGDLVNLERSLRVGDELGGHIVSGHVDGLGTVLAVTAEGEGRRVRIEAPTALAPLIAPKGSVAVEGVSLTVNEVDGTTFGVLIIPHTWAVTTLGRLAPGARVNLEADMLARYVSRILAMR